MFGDVVPPAQRAEIISFDKDGKQKVDQGGVMRKPVQQPAPRQAAPAAPSPAPQIVQAPVAPAPAPVAQPVPAPAPKPAVAKVKNPASAKEVSKALASDAVGSVVDKLRATAMAQGGVLTLNDLDSMQTAMAEQMRDIEKQMEQAFETFTVATERAKWEPERNDVFYRLLVKQFSHLFKEPVGRKTVCRRMLPGFFMAVVMLLGPNVVEGYHDRCRGIVARLKTEHGGEPFDWDRYYTEKDALAVLIDAQLTIAAGFADYDKRMQWFMTLVNSHLAPIAESDSEAVRRWELAEPGFRRMLDALLGNLRKVLSSDKGRERLMKRHGAETVTQALTALKRIVTG